MLDSLKHISLFQDLQHPQLAQLDPLFEFYTCPPKTLIFAQGDPVSHLYIILSGAVSIVYKPYDGPSITLTHLGVGDAFGWSAVVGSSRYTSGIVSDTRLEAVRIRGSDLWDLCVEHPQTGEMVLDRLARIVSTRWKNAHEQVHSMLDAARENATDAQKKREKGHNMSATSNHDLEPQIRSLLERLSAYVEQFHGGTVEYVAFDGKTLKVRLGGACLGCPLQPATLHGWVAGTVHQFFPDVEVVAEK
jgi:CRP-like cAMP-binding protein